MNLVSAEILKLRKRRGLVATTAVLTLVPIAVAYTVLAILHASDPAAHGPAGGIDDLRGSMSVLTQIGIVAAIIVGATAGAGDLAGGVFRELVVTGRSRLRLFAVRIPGGLGFLLPFVAVAFGIAATASVVLAGTEPAPGAELLARYGGWLAVVTASSYLLALGVSSITGSRGMTIGFLLAWQLAAAPVLLATGKLDAVLPNAAFAWLQPGDASSVSMSLVQAATVLSAWAAVPLVAGAWRTQTRDA